MSDYLIHHGIKGQKWGVRRYQNEDGSLTVAGRKRYDSDGPKKDHSGLKKALAIGAGVAAAGGAAYLLSKNPDAQAALLNGASRALNSASGVVKSIPNAANKTAASVSESMKKSLPKVEAALQKAGDATMKELKSTTIEVGKAMKSAAIMSIAAIQISKLEKNFEEMNRDADERTRERNKVLLDATKAGIQKAASVSGGHGSGSGGNNQNKGGSVGADVTEKIGAPSNKENAKQNPKYSTLFKDSNGNQRDENTRATIKAMASAGYDVDQIQKYLNSSISHSDMHIGAIYYRGLAFARDCNLVL